MVAVLVQSAGSARVFAAPIAKDIVKAYYDKKQGKLPSQLISKAGSTPGAAPAEIAQVQSLPNPAAPQATCQARPAPRTPSSDETSAGTQHLS